MGYRSPRPGLNWMQCEGVREVPVWGLGQMGKAVSLEAGRRGGARPGARRGLLTDPVGPEPSWDPRLRQLSVNPLVTL